MVCDKVVCERWWVKDCVWQSSVWKVVCDKVESKMVCETLCVKDGVCVWNIWIDVKLLPWYFPKSSRGSPEVLNLSLVFNLIFSKGFQSEFQQWDGVCFRCLHPTKTHLLHSDMDWGRSIHVPAQSFSVMGRGSTQEPPCRHFAILQFRNFRCNVVEICKGRSRFGSDGTVTSSKDVERFPSQGFSLLVIQLLLSGLTEVFLHVRCIPHQ